MDFSEAAYLDRLVPVTRNTILMRRVVPSWEALESRGTRHFLDGGAERLVLKWKSLMQLLIEKNGGTHIGAKPTPEMEDLLHKSGSALYEPDEAQFKEDTLPGHELKTSQRTWPLFKTIGQIRTKNGTFSMSTLTET